MSDAMFYFLAILFVIACFAIHPVLGVIALWCLYKIWQAPDG